MGADRAAPDLALARVVGGQRQRAARGAVADRGAHDPLRVEAVEDRLEPGGLAADQAVALDLDVVEEEQPLLVRARRDGRDLLALEAGGVGVDEGDDRQAERAVGLAHARDDQDRVGLLDPGDERLLAAQRVAVVGADRGRGDVVRVRAGVRLCDRKGDLGRAGADPAQPALLLLRRAVADQDAADDRRRDDDQQQAGAGRGDLLADRRERGHPQAAPVVLLRDVHAEEAAARELVPQLGRRLAPLPLLARVRRAELRADARHGLPDPRLFVGRHEGQCGRGGLGGGHGGGSWARK
jgi:hypothetical protein